MRKYFQVAVWLLWLALPATALNYWRAWDRLPDRMAVHFNANWQPNGWTTKEGALLFAMAVIGFMLVVCTAASYAVLALKPQSSWPVLISFYVALGFCVYGSNALIEYNLGEQIKMRAQVELKVKTGRKEPHSRAVDWQLSRG
jgi:hypothetical protein